jgi:hypothetical protein
MQIGTAERFAWDFSGEPSLALKLNVKTKGEMVSSSNHIPPSATWASTG